MSIIFKNKYGRHKIKHANFWPKIQTIWNSKSQRYYWSHNWYLLLTSTRLQTSHTYLPWQVPWTYTPSISFFSKTQTQNDKVYNVLPHKCRRKIVSCAIQKSHGQTRIILQWLRTIRFYCMRKYRALIHLIHTTRYNSMDDKQTLFPLILYMRVRTYYTNTSTYTQNTIRNLSHTSIYSYYYTYDDTSAYTSTQNLTLRPSYTYNTCSIIHKKIIMRQRFTHTWKFLQTKTVTTYKLTKAKS